MPCQRRDALLTLYLSKSSPTPIIFSFHKLLLSLPSTLSDVDFIKSLEMEGF